VSSIDFWRHLTNGFWVSTESFLICLSDQWSWMEREPPNKIGIFFQSLSVLLNKRLGSPTDLNYNIDICKFQIYLFQFPSKITDGPWINSRLCKTDTHLNGVGFWLGLVCLFFLIEIYLFGTLLLIILSFHLANDICSVHSQ